MNIILLKFSSNGTIFFLFDCNSWHFLDICNMYGTPMGYMNKRWEPFQIVCLNELFLILILGLVVVLRRKLRLTSWIIWLFMCRSSERDIIRYQLWHRPHTKRFVFFLLTYSFTFIFFCSSLYWCSNYIIIFFSDYGLLRSSEDCCTDDDVSSVSD